MEEEETGRSPGGEGGFAGAQGRSVSRGTESGRRPVNTAERASQAWRGLKDLPRSETWKSFDKVPFRWNDGHGSQIGVG